MSHSEIFRYIYEFRVVLSDDHWGHRMTTCIMEIFDENDDIIRARPEFCLKSFTFYKKDINPLAEKEFFQKLPTIALDLVDRRISAFNRAFCIYILSQDKNKGSEFQEHLGRVLDAALKGLRDSRKR